MRFALATLVLLSTPAGAAPGPHGPGCALTTAECLQVVRELAIEAELDAGDARTFGRMMSPFDRDMALVDRRYARIMARLPRLPIPIANEVGRIIACRAADRLQAIDGTPNTRPDCR